MTDLRSLVSRYSKQIDALLRLLKFDLTETVSEMKLAAIHFDCEFEDENAGLLDLIDDLDEKTRTLVAAAATGTRHDKIAARHGCHGALIKMMEAAPAKAIKIPAPVSS